MPSNHSFDIISGFNKSDSAKFDAKELINLFVDKNPTGKKGKAAFATPGLSSENGVIFPPTDGGGRRLYKFQDTLYAIIGTKIYRITSGLAYSPIGDLNTTSGHVGIADNGTEILFVDGTGGWLFNTSTSVFQQVFAAGFPALPTDVTVLGSRFIVSRANSNKLHFSAIGDGLTWNALDEFAITAQPDDVIGLRRLNDRIFIMGNRITEVWYDAGDAVLPYRRSDVLPYGCSSASSISTAFGFLMWLAKDDNGVGSVVITTGTEPTGVSTKAIENQFQEYETTDDATAFIYRNEQGHTFYRLNFTTANKSWEYDIGEKIWAEIKYGVGTRGLPEDHAYFNNKHYVLDYSSTKLLEMSKYHFTDDGINIRRSIVTAPLFDSKYRRITLHSILFDLKQGVGLDGDGIDSDPTLRLQVSRDGGITYGNELSEKIGKIGEREYRTQFFRLGNARSFTLRVSYDNDTPFVILGSSVNIDVQQGGF